MKELLQIMDEKELLVHVITMEDEEKEIYKLYNEYMNTKRTPSPLDRLYVMQGVNVVHIGNENTIESFARNFN